MNLILAGVSHKTSPLEVNKILHTPFTELKHAAARPDRSEFLDVVRTIFHLEEDSEVSLAIN